MADIPSPPMCERTWVQVHPPEDSRRARMERMKITHYCKLRDWPGHLHVCYCGEMWRDDG